MGMIFLSTLSVSAAASDDVLTERWTTEKANQWYAGEPWRVGCNFIPSTAINQLEMWQAETWDPETIDRELGWAAEMGMNTVRVYLHDLAWEADAEGFKKRIDQFLTIAEKHNIKPMLVFFDDCWNDNPKIGKQPEPKPSMHNSGWLQSPGKAVVNDPAQWGRLERYVKDILSTFAEDPRILFWDLYNEPGNKGQKARSLPLLKETFKWARAVNPTQPLSAGIWFDNKELNNFQLAASDIITFHNYGAVSWLEKQIGDLKKHDRPLLCTEWLRRGHSEVFNFLPVFKKENVGCYNWGLVSGKTQTIWPWGTKEGAPEPKRWFHDLLRKDGTPHSPKEAKLFKELTNKNNQKKISKPNSLFSYHNDFESYDKGLVPKGAAGSGKATLTVTDAVAASGKKSLAFRDDKHGHKPHYPFLYITVPEEAVGAEYISMAFDVMNSADLPGKLSLELRNYSRFPMAQFTVSAEPDGHIVIGDQRIKAPLGSWYRVNLQFDLSDPLNRTLTGSVTGKEIGEQKFELQIKDPNFTTLSWVGFMTPSTNRADMYVDNVDLTIKSWQQTEDGVLTRQWSKEKANQWYARQPWRVGCNFIPSTAINQLEMWQAETWDPETIDRELGWAAEMGMNTVRVYLHDLAWEVDAEGFKKRIDQFLTIAETHNIKPMLVFFDDCWNDNPKIGKQPDPKPSVHNSGWLQSPGKAVVNDPAQWGRLESYVKDILRTFGKDHRILFWDLYNEPGNSGQGGRSLPLLKETFKWARTVNPSQPLSSGLWNKNLKELNDFQLAASDIITFHCYRMAPGLLSEIQEFKQHGRPLLCTEWLRRGHSEVAIFLPIFKEENIGCYNWGLVSGKTQTIWPWGTKEGAPEPKRWFHDLLKKDGTPHVAEEAKLFRQLTDRKEKKAKAPMVKELESYVYQFNAVDEEEGVNTIHNEDAFAFMADNVPLFDCPDKDIERTWYYRWWTYRKHLRETDDGWVVTEFYPNVSWAKKHNTINCPVGHQIYEGRWLRDPKFINDYIKFHFGEGGNPGGDTKHYSNWLTDAIYAHYLVTGDKAFVTSLLDDLIANRRAYSRDGKGGKAKNRFLKDIGLYWQIDSMDGSEFSISGHGIRLTINSYLYGGAVAIANIADLAGKPQVAKAYRQEAETLKQTIQSRLWDPEDQFFKTLRDSRAWHYNHANQEACKSGSLVKVRELFGYAPWYFNMPDAGKGYEIAWAQLTDQQGFKGEYGPGFAERRHPKFTINKGGCVWAGSSWPMATAQTLTALANLLNNYEQDVIGKQDYFDTLRAYARSQQMTLKDGSVVPWIDESLNQDTGRWISIGNYPKTRGRYYNHSSYCDLIISGLVGLRPRADDVIEVNPLLPDDSWEYFCLDKVPYRGRLLTIVWDKTGTRYNKGKGLTVFADGQKIANADTLTRVTGNFAK
jgi:hypothetical protein